MQGKLNPAQAKEPYGNSKWLLVDFHPATRSVQRTSVCLESPRRWYGSIYESHPKNEANYSLN